VGSLFDEPHPSLEVSADPYHAMKERLQIPLFPTAGDQRMTKLHFPWLPVHLLQELRCVEVWKSAQSISSCCLYRHFPCNSVYRPLKGQGEEHKKALYEPFCFSLPERYISS
jgi:hypothetical protein